MVVIARNAYLDVAIDAVKQCLAKLGLNEAFKWLERIETDFEESQLPNRTEASVVFHFIFNNTGEEPFTAAVEINRVNGSKRPTEVWMVRRVDIGTPTDRYALMFYFTKYGTALKAREFFDHIVAWSGKFPYRIGHYHGDLRDWWQEFLRNFKWRFLDRSYRGA